MPVMLMLISSVIFMGPIVTNPGSTVARVMSLLPFSAPIIMPLRLALGSVPWYELTISLVGVLLAWGVAQWDYLLPESLTVSAAAAPSGTITAVLVATALAAVLIVPGFVLLYVLDQKSLLPEEGMPDPADDAQRAGHP